MTNVTQKKMDSGGSPPLKVVIGPLGATLIQYELPKLKSPPPLPKK